MCYVHHWGASRQGTQDRNFQCLERQGPGASCRLAGWPVIPRFMQRFYFGTGMFREEILWNHYGVPPAAITLWGQMWNHTPLISVFGESGQRQGNWSLWVSGHSLLHGKFQDSQDTVRYLNIPDKIECCPRSISQQRRTATEMLLLNILSSGRVFCSPYH